MRLILLIIALLCVGYNSSAQPSQPTPFTVDEAKTYVMSFEDQAEYKMPYVGGFSKERYAIKFDYYFTMPDEGNLSPGRYRIIFNEAAYSKKGSSYALSVPIDAKKHYKAYRVESGDSIPLTQRLLLYKHTDVRNKFSQYIVTFIPSEKYIYKYGDAPYTRFIHVDNTGSFDGIAIFANPSTGKFVAAMNGRKRVSIPKSLSNEEALEMLREAILLDVEIKAVE